MARPTETRLKMIVTGAGLQPHSAYDGDVLSAYAVGSEVEVTIYMKRSAGQLRLFWAILRHVLPNTDFVATTALADHLQIRAGFVKGYTTMGGGQTVEPHPGSIRDMDAPTFAAFFERAMEALSVEIVPGLDVEQVKREMAARVGRDR